MGIGRSPIIGLASSAFTAGVAVAAPMVHPSPLRERDNEKALLPCGGFIDTAKMGGVGYR